MSDAEAQNDRGNVLLTNGDVEGAIDCYRAALAIAPEHAEIHFNLANTLAQSGERLAALVSYNRALELDPTHAGAHNNLGNLFRKLHRPPTRWNATGAHFISVHRTRSRATIWAPRCWTCIGPRRR